MTGVQSTTRQFSWPSFWHAISLVLALGMILFVMAGCVRDARIECAIPTEWCPLVYPKVTPSISPTGSRLPVYQIDI